MDIAHISNKPTYGRTRHRLLGYDFPPHPVSDTTNERRPSTSTTLRGIAKLTNGDKPKRVVTTVRQTVSNNNDAADDAKTGGYVDAKNISIPAASRTPVTKSDDATAKDEANNAGSLITSWNDRFVANTTNTLDASVRIGSGTVASRVNNLTRHNHKATDTVRTPRQ